MLRSSPQIYNYSSITISCVLLVHSLINTTNSPLMIVSWIITAQWRQDKWCTGCGFHGDENSGKSDHWVWFPWRREQWEKWCTGCGFHWDENSGKSDSPYVVSMETRTVVKAIHRMWFPLRREQWEKRFTVCGFHGDDNSGKSDALGMVSMETRTVGKAIHRVWFPWRREQWEKWFTVCGCHGDENSGKSDALGMVSLERTVMYFCQFEQSAFFVYSHLHISTIPRVYVIVWHMFMLSYHYLKVTYSTSSNVCICIHCCNHHSFIITICLMWRYHCSIFYLLLIDWYVSECKFPDCVDKL
jgi:hypothetical protein